MPGDHGHPHPPHVAVFGPDPLLSITIEARGADDDVHVHAAGQGVWVARMAGELGAWPVLCCLLGGETGVLLDVLLGKLPGERRIARMAAASGSYVADRRGGGRKLMATSLRPPPQRHELDDLVSATITAAQHSACLVVCNPYPDDGFPREVFESLVANVRAAGIPVLVDLSSPRLDWVLPYAPDLVKLNDWELAQYVYGPVDGALALLAVRRLQADGARAVALTRADAPVLVMPPAGEPFEIVPPAMVRGHREGCGDTMMGAIAAAWSRGSSLQDAIVLGCAAGTANFLRHGLGTGKRQTVLEMATRVQVRPLDAATRGVPGTARSAGGR